MGSSQTRAQTHVPCIGRQILNHCTTRETPNSITIEKCFSLSFSWIKWANYLLKLHPIIVLYWFDLLNLIPHSLAVRQGRKGPTSYVVTLNWPTPRISVPRPSKPSAFLCHPPSWLPACLLHLATPCLLASNFYIQTLIVWNPHLLTQECSDVIVPASIFSCVSSQRQPHPLPLGPALDWAPLVPCSLHDIVLIFLDPSPLHFPISFTAILF